MLGDLWTELEASCSGLLNDLFKQTYLCRDLLKPKYGLHATFYKLPLQALQPGFLELKENARQRLAKTNETTHPDNDRVVPGESTIIQTLGYWDALAIKYVDDFAEITDGGPMNSAMAEKSFYGYLLATNSGVEQGSGRTDRLEYPPLHEIDQIGLKNDPGLLRSAVFSHFKINPLLLYSGRTDLILHTAAFIALVFAAPEEYWSLPSTQTVLARLEKLVPSARRSEVRRNFSKILPKMSRLTKGAKFLIYQNLDWNDFSVYIAARSAEDAINISSFIRDLPLLCPNLAFRLCLKGLGNLGNNYRDACQDKFSKGKEDLEDLAKLLLKQEQLSAIERATGGGQHSEPRISTPDEAREIAYELPLFWSHVDTVALLRSEEGGHRGLILAETVNAKPGQTARLLLEQEEFDLEREKHDGSLSDFRTLSGPKDLIRVIGNDPSRLRRASERPRETKKWTYAFGEIDPKLLYNGPEDIYQYCDDLGVLLSQKFKHSDWEDLNKLLGKLGTPRQLTFIFRHLVLAHLAYKNDALMFNALYDYQHLWRNLKREIKATVKIRQERPEKANVSGLLEKMNSFAERVGQAINTRYHGSIRMFEVRDLSLNHRGGVDSFLDAYAQLVRAVLGAVEHIDHSSHHGIVNVTTAPWPQVRPLFGCVVELDWLRLSNPETLFAVIHELGHQVLMDKVFQLIAEMLPAKNDTWRKVLLGRWKDTEKDYSEAAGFLAETSDLFTDIFCDVFMMRIVRQALSGDCPDPTGDLLYFYDRWYWTIFESHLQQTKSPAADGSDIGTRFVANMAIRWLIVRGIVGSWKKPIEADLEPAMWVTQLAKGFQRASKRDFDELEKAQESLGRYCSARRQLDLPGLGIGLRELLQLPCKFSPSFALVANRGKRPGLYDAVDAGIRWMFRADEVGVSPAHHFINLSEIVLSTLVDQHLERKPKERRRLRVLRSALKYCRTIFERSLDQATPEKPCYTHFRQAVGDPGSVKPMEYTDVVINARGTPFGRGGPLRLQLFGDRLGIFNELAEGRLEWIVDELIGKDKPTDADTDTDYLEI